MSTLEQDRIWYTRCPVPTASGLAHNLGWLAEEYAADGLEVGILQDAAPEIAARHFDHRLVGLFREGGNVPALVARSEGAPTRLIGLTWIDESQVIVVRPDSGITAPEHLAGKRVALPALAADRARSFPRAMALHGFVGALGTIGLSIADVTLVEVPTGQGDVGRGAEGGSSLFGIEALAAGDVDAVYIKGAQAAEQAVTHGLVIGIDLDSFADRRFRVNNGTPRPITVHEQLLAERPDLVVRFLVRTLRAADWAADNLDQVREILARETRAGAKGVELAYRDGFHRALHPDLSDERLGLLTRQKNFLLAHGFLARDIDIDAWAAHEPLAEALRQVDR
ncbi:ABC transporter substrate-binding protein [Actinokineospora enzanensis]|uniref:ABC transporter substrate-binding protein n=1 Tax=Actinokineospora enzanensis TaxID=155975 RepID=UPI00037C4210|nr:ABC transporter substrate-binding protein [Actinokineospora enzanensis]